MLVAEATLEGLITEFLTEFQQSLVTYLADNDRNATGNSSASIKLNSVSDSGGQVIANSSIEFVFRGRRAGGIPPISKIIDWCVARGIPRSLAWAIAIKISQEGTKLYRDSHGAIYNDNALTQALTPEKIADFSKNISVLLATELVSDINNIIR